MLRVWDGKLQHFGQGRCSGLMQPCSEGVLHRFQIDLAAPAAFGKDPAQDLIDFPRDFLMDCSSRFFS